MNRSMIALIVAVLASTSVAGGAVPPKFVKKPAVTKAGDKIRIEFVVDRETDVAVYIENTLGGIIRHLAAGVLGDNAPAPLKSGSLTQSIEWDGRDDDGKPATGGPFRVRVAAGLKVGYAGTLFSDNTGPNNLVDVMGMAAGPDGRLYVLSHRWQRYVAHSTAVHVFRRDGSYEKTIKPMPGNLPEDRVKATGAFLTRQEGLVPLIYRSLLDGPRYYPNNDTPHQPAVTPDGRLVLAVTPCNLAVLGADGGISSATYAGPSLVNQKAFTAPLPNSTGGFISFNIPYLALDPDGKTVFMTGLGSVRSIPNAGRRAFNDHAVYGAPLAPRGPAEVVFGEPAVSGNDDKHLSDPRGVACDGKGHLLIADFGNDRVVVLDEKEKTFAGSFPVKSPFWVGVDAKTGAIYVGAKRSSLLKFSSWKAPKEGASVDFADLLEKVSRNSRPATPVHFAVDASVQPPVVWAGCGGALVRFEDRGAKFSDPQPAAAYAPPNPWNLSVDPTRRDVACQVGPLQIINEETGKVENVKVEGGRTYRLGPDGHAYGQHHSGQTKLARFDRKGKMVPFASTANDKQLKGAIANRPEGTTYWPRDFYVDRRGDIYVKNRGETYHGLMSVEQYGPDGALKRTAIWVTTDGALGPRVDPRGNLYMAECVKPLGQPYPEIFQDRLIAGTADGSSGFTLHTGYSSMHTEYTWMYGSIVKYGPKGGAAWFPLPPDRAYPVQGECKLDPALKKEKVSGTRGTRMIKELDLQGALWTRFGFAYLADMSGCGTDRCHCTASDFDVDDFGRTFFPNQGLFRVEVLDANGNKILNVGGYGNQDSCGPDSYVLDPVGKFFRPRKADDPKEMASPFAQPDMAFNWFVGLAVSDRYLYVADGANRRVLRGKLDYATQETCEVK